jgi:hydrogenase 3 maturation protease
VAFNGILKGKLSIICVGNELNGDDGAGHMLYELLKGKIPHQLIYAYTAPENFIDEIIEYSPEKILLVDACDFGGTPGQTKTIEPDKIQKTHFSTHRAPLGILIRQLKQKKIQTQIIGIQPGDTGLGSPITAEVAKSVRELAKHIMSFDNL